MKTAKTCVAAALSLLILAVFLVGSLVYLAAYSIVGLAEMGMKGITNTFK